MKKILEKNIGSLLIVLLAMLVSIQGAFAANDKANNEGGNETMETGGGGQPSCRC